MVVEAVKRIEDRELDFFRGSAIRMVLPGVTIYRYYLLSPRLEGVAERAICW